MPVYVNLVLKNSATIQRKHAVHASWDTTKKIWAILNARAVQLVHLQIPHKVWLVNYVHSTMMLSWAQTQPSQMHPLRTLIVSVIWDIITRRRSNHANHARVVLSNLTKACKLAPYAALISFFTITVTMKLAPIPRLTVCNVHSTRDKIPTTSPMINSWMTSQPVSAFPGTTRGQTHPAPNVKIMSSKLASTMTNVLSVRTESFSEITTLSVEIAI